MQLSLTSYKISLIPIKVLLAGPNELLTLPSKLKYLIIFSSFIQILFRKVLFKVPNETARSMREGIVASSSHLISSAVLLTLFQNKLGFFRKNTQALECLRLSSSDHCSRHSQSVICTFDKKWQVLAFHIVSWTRFRTIAATCKFQTIIEMSATVD